MAYSTVDELARRLGLASPTADQRTQAQQALDAAAGEIESHLGWEPGGPVDLTTQERALVAIVNVDRAAEHWRLTPFGALGQGPELAPILTARDSWYRHARKLASLARSWGVA